MLNDNVWISLTRFTSEEKIRMIRIVKMVRSSLDERWSYMHELKNSMQSIYYDNYANIEREITEYIRESDMYYMHHCEQLEYFINTVTTKAFIPMSVVTNFFILIGIYVPFFGNKIKKDISDLCEGKYYQICAHYEADDVYVLTREDDPTGTEVIEITKDEMLDIIMNKP